MQKIIVLSEELISQIAAGEVIERPASALKELLENSIDAGSDKISVEIEEGGLKKIRVSDNGSGMCAEDARLSFKKHATSKIKSIEDLFHVKSLGFRGEALASIASIARVVLETCSERIGTLVEIDGGKEIRFEESACSKGTDISIFGLFQHTPVRKKYMKQERTEYGHIFEVLANVALSHPEISFKLKNNNEEVFDLPGRQSLKERIRSLYGEAANALIPISYQQSNLILSGFVGKPELSRTSKKYQFLFVNGRPIEDRMISHAVKDAFHSLLMHEKFPWYLIDMQIDPNLIDVNVHPRKLEIRFLNQQEVFRVVMSTIHHALEANVLAPIIGQPKVEFTREAEAGIRPVFELNADLRSVQSIREAIPQKLIEFEKVYMRPIAQVANSYIVAESEEGLILIDQHAAHERVRYAGLMENLESKKIEKQAVLVPLELELGKDGFRIVKDHLADFELLGFDLEEFGGRTFLLRATPFGVRNPDAFLNEIISDLSSNPVKDFRETLLTYTACRGAIKFGDNLTISEMEALIRDMEKTKHCSHCPHGRPAFVTLTFDGLETMFKRKNF
ncbi:MAG: DNA mismatch repair endonuclease MutL [Patescibacteria group bacterium]